MKKVQNQKMKTSQKNNWQTKKLGEICGLLNGFAFKSSDYSKSGFFVIRIGNVQDGYINLDDPKYIKNSRKDFILDEGDILISLTGNVGRVGVIKIEHLPAVLNQRVAKIKLKSDTSLNKSFLLHFLKSDFFIQKLISYGHGAAQQNVSIKDIEKIDISFPSLSEQKRIVKILDEAFEKLQKVKENTEKNLQNSKELFESYLNNIFSNPGKDWEEKKLEEVVDFRGGGTPSKSVKKYWNGDIPWVSPKDVKTKEIFGSIDHVSQEAILNSATNLLPENSILIVVRSGVLAHTIPIAITRNKVTINQDLKALILKSLIDADYLYYACLANEAKLLNQVNKGATVHRLQSDFLKNLIVAFPKSIQKQKQIVKKLDQLSEKTQKLESLYKQKLDNIEEIKKSILQKAFSGEL